MVQLKRMLRAMALTAFAAVLVGPLSGEVRAEPGRSWTLESQSGQVNLVKPGIAPVSLSTGDVFADGDWIETGPDGRAMLRRGEETIVVAPNSRIGLPENNNGPYATRILQTLGTILLTVQKKAEQHFEIETPYLTAVVKGTTFTVGIQDGRAVVHVVEGLVEVKNLSSGRSSLIRPGQTGSVIRGGGDVEIGGGGDRVPATQARRATQATTAPAASQASSVAVAAVPGGKSTKVRILRALGPTALDLSQSTKGLVRAARAGQGDTLGGGTKPGKKVDTARELKAKDKGPKSDKSQKSISGLRGGAEAAKPSKSSGAIGGLKGGSKAAKVGKIAGIVNNPGHLGSTSLALNNSVSANSPVSGKGLDIGKEAEKSKGNNKDRDKNR